MKMRTWAVLVGLLTLALTLPASLEDAPNLLKNGDFEACFLPPPYAGFEWGRVNLDPSDDTCIGANEGQGNTGSAFRLKQSDAASKMLTQTILIDGGVGDGVAFSCYFKTWGTVFTRKAVNIRLALYYNDILVKNRVTPVALIDSEWVESVAAVTTTAEYNRAEVWIKVKKKKPDAPLGAFILVDDCSLIRIPSP